jgi:hypothetical protein
LDARSAGEGRAVRPGPPYLLDRFHGVGKFGLAGNITGDPKKSLSTIEKLGLAGQGVITKSQVKIG